MCGFEVFPADGIGSEVVRVARQDRVAHISKQSSDPFRSYLKCRSQIERVPSVD